MGMSRRRRSCASSRTTGCRASVWAAAHSMRRRAVSWTCSTSRGDPRIRRSSSALIPARRPGTITPNRRVSDWLRAGAAGLRLGALLLAAAGSLAAGPFYPHPVALREPARQPLSAVAELGAKLFHDEHLSGSGRLSCASCHSPAHAYGPPNSGAVMLGGPRLTAPGVRAVPSLCYLYRQPAFSIGPDSTGDNDQVIPLAQQALQAAGHPRVLKTATTPQAAAANLVPQGGLFWDGRADTLEQQINGPLYNPLEMAAGSPARVIGKLRSAPYAEDFVRLFGP